MPKLRVKRHAVTQPLDKPYRYIALTQGKIAIVDVEDFDWLSQWNWCAHWKPDTKSFCAVRRQHGCLIYMHREIVGCGANEVCDHKFHDTLDNRKENLRKCTHKQNQYNMRKPAHNTSGFKGVTLHRDKRRWKAQIGVAGRNFHLGCFDSKEEAARAYDEAARIYHGAFAHLNFPVSSR